MVPADSRRISRAPRYSGYRYAACRFGYGTITLCGPSFQKTLLSAWRAMTRSYNPAHARRTRTVWALPRSLAATGGIIKLFSLPGGTKMFQFPPLASAKIRMGILQIPGLSHSETRGSRVICTYPRIIAAYHVLHRLDEPRHPPYALIYFLIRSVPFPIRIRRTAHAHTFSCFVM